MKQNLQWRLIDIPFFLKKVEERLCVIKGTGEGTPGEMPMNRQEGPKMGSSLTQKHGQFSRVEKEEECVEADVSPCEHVMRTGGSASPGFYFLSAIVISLQLVLLFDDDLMP